MMHPFKNSIVAIASALSAFAMMASTAAAQQVPASEGTYDREAVETKGKVGEFRIGEADAKVTVVEYVSLTCGACAAFHNNSFSEIKKDYVDTGKVEFVQRFLLRNQIDAAVSTLSQCIGDKGLAFSGKLMEDQSAWLQAASPLAKLQELSAEFGLDKGGFESCLKDTDLVRSIIAESDHASDKLQVQSTPTFFINGVKYSGVLSPTDFSTIVDPLLN